MRIEELKQQFMALCRPLADRPDVLYTEFEQDKRACIFTMLLRNTKIQLVYCWKWENVAPPSVLYCRVYLNKNVPLYLHLPELICALGTQDFRACYYPCIENTRRMDACFRALMAVVDDYIPQAEALAISGQDNEIMERQFQVDFWGNALGQDDKSWHYYDPDARSVMETMDRLSECIMVDRFTGMDAYQAFLTGDWEKSLKKYKKLEKGGLSQYEKDLCAFMAQPENRTFQAMPPECMAILDYRKIASGSIRDLGYMLLCAIPWSLVFCALIAAANWLMARGTVSFFGAHPLCGLIPGLACGVFGYILLQKQILRLLKRRRELDFAEMMDHHPKIRQLGAIIFALVLAVSLGFSVAMPLMGSRFYEDHALIYEEGLRSNRVEYSEIREIYYIQGRYNDYGDLISRPSYVLILRSGEAIDLDCTASVKKQMELIETIFEDFTVIEVESDRNLP